jgi:teichuronic acid biosynthesis protein TuaE
MRIKFEQILYFFIFSTYVAVGLSYSKLYLFHISSVIILFSIILYSSQLKSFKISTPAFPIVGFFYLWLLFDILSISWAIDKEQAVIYSIIHIFVTIIVFVFTGFINTENRLQKSFKLIGYLFVFELILATLEAYTPIRWPNSPFSKYAGFFGRSVEDTIFLDKALYILTLPTGFRGNSNDLCVVFVLFLPFVLSIKNFYRKLTLASLILLCIINSDSQGVFLSFLLGLFLFYSLKNMRFFISTAFLGSIIFFTLLIFPDILKFSSNEKVVAIYGSIESLKNYLNADNLDIRSGSSIDIRKTLVYEGLQSFKNNPWFGVGAGNSLSIVKYANFDGTPIRSLHNFWLEILVNNGIFILLYFMIWFIIILKRLYGIYSTIENDFYKSISYSFFISISISIIAVISSSSAMYSLPIWMLYSLAIAFVHLSSKYIKKNESINSI